MEALFRSALGIESPWYVKDISFDLELKRLDIDLDFTRGSKFELDGEMCAVHDTVCKRWRHLNFFEHECYLHARVPRVKGSDGKVKLILPPWSGKLDGFTLLFEAMCVEFCKHMPVSQVGRLVGVSDFKLWRMLELYVAQARYDEDYSDVSVIGMDETSLAKRHHYITLFVDMVRKRTLFITPGKGADTVKDFAADLEQHHAHANQVTNVSCDMSPAFIKGVRDQLPNAAITFDKFHVIKIINDAVDQIRREEAKTNPLLKGKRYLFIKNRTNFSKKQQDTLETLQMEHLNLSTMKALHIRENFQQIYQAWSMGQFISWLRKWVTWVKQSGLKPMEKAADMVLNHWNGIIQWKQSQLTNGLLEGLNSVIQAAKRKARGYKQKHFITIAYLLTGKLNLNKVNPNCS